MKYRSPLSVPLVISTDRVVSKRMGKSVTAALAFTLYLAAAAPSAFGQSTCPQPVAPPATDPLHTTIPVHFDASTGDITVGSKTYCGQNPGFHLLALQRQPDSSHLDAPDMLLDQTYTDAASANSALQQISGTGGGPLVMVNAVGGYGIFLSDVAKRLKPFGAYPDLQLINAAPPFIFIGNAGRNAQTALQRGSSTFPLDGYLAQDSNNNYTFTQTDFVRYDIATDGTIKIGRTTYDVASSYKPGCTGDASNSFHLVVVDRESLQPWNINNTYCTAQNDVEITRLVGDISAHLVSNESVLVFLASNGHPIPANWNFGTDGDARFYPLAQQIVKLGGYWETMVYLTPNDTYSLIGAAAPPSYLADARARARESSSVYPADVNGKSLSGELHGVLVRGRGNWYSPLNADPTGLANLGLYSILAKTSVSFPSFTGDRLSAYQYINQQLCGSANCVRNAYGNLNIDLATYLTNLSNLRDPNNKNCNNSDNAGLPFCKVRAQLLTELTDAANVLAFYDNVNNLWSSSGTVTLASQLGVYNDVKATLPAPPTAEAPSLVKPIVGLFLGLGSNIPVIGPALGLADVFFNFATELTTDPQGNKQIDLTSTIGDLQTQAAKQFIAQANTTGTLFQLMLQDWGKLNALGSVLIDQSKPGSPWYWSLTTTSQMLQNMQAPIRQAAYQSIMPAAYAIGSFLPQSNYNCGPAPPNPPLWGQTPLWLQTWSYGVLDGGFPCPGGPGVTPVVQPFNSGWGANNYIPYTYPTDPINPYANDPRTGTILADGSWLGISLQTSPYSSNPATGHYDPPDWSLLSTLFTPVSDRGLGVYRPAFFEGWPFPRIACSPAFNVPDGNGGHYVGGCDWSAGKPVTVPLPKDEAITMQAAQIASDHTEVDVQLTISNNETVSANSIDITSISLRTLAGSGQATVLSPNLPIRIDRLVPGDSTDVVLKLSIPTGITKLSITEQGSVDLGSKLAKLSEGQVLYPQR
jgi:hypothetical protein